MNRYINDFHHNFTFLTLVWYSSLMVVISSMIRLLPFFLLSEIYIEFDTLWCATVFASIALTQVWTFHTHLEAFAVLFETIWFLAITAFKMLDIFIWLKMYKYLILPIKLLVEKLLDYDLVSISLIPFYRECDVHC